MFQYKYEVHSTNYITGSLYDVIDGLLLKITGLKKKYGEEHLCNIKLNSETHELINEIVTLCGAIKDIVLPAFDHQKELNKADWICMLGCLGVGIMKLIKKLLTNEDINVYSHPMLCELLEEITALIPQSPQDIEKLISFLNPQALLAISHISDSVSDWGIRTALKLLGLPYFGLKYLKPKDEDQHLYIYHLTTIGNTKCCYFTRMTNDFLKFIEEQLKTSEKIAYKHFNYSHYIVTEDDLYYYNALRHELTRVIPTNNRQLNLKMSLFSSYAASIHAFPNSFLLTEEQLQEITSATGHVQGKEIYAKVKRIDLAVFVSRQLSKLSYILKDLYEFNDYHGVLEIEQLKDRRIWLTTLAELYCQAIELEVRQHEKKCEVIKQKKQEDDVTKNKQIKKMDIETDEAKIIIKIQEIDEEIKSYCSLLEHSQTLQDKLVEQYDILKKISINDLLTAHPRLVPQGNSNNLIPNHDRPLPTFILIEKYECVKEQIARLEEYDEILQKWIGNLTSNKKMKLSKLKIMVKQSINVKIKEKRERLDTHTNKHVQRNLRKLHSNVVEFTDQKKLEHLSNRIETAEGWMLQVNNAEKAIADLRLEIENTLCEFVQKYCDILDKDLLEKTLIVEAKSFICRASSISKRNKKIQDTLSSLISQLEKDKASVVFAMGLNSLDIEAMQALLANACNELEVLEEEHKILKKTREQKEKEAKQQKDIDKLSKEKLDLEGSIQFCDHAIKNSLQEISKLSETDKKSDEAILMSLITLHNESILLKEEYQNNLLVIIEKILREQRQLLEKEIQDKRLLSEVVENCTKLSNQITQSKQTVFFFETSIAIFKDIKKFKAQVTVFENSQVFSISEEQVCTKDVASILNGLYDQLVKLDLDRCKLAKQIAAFTNALADGGEEYQVKADAMSKMLKSMEVSLQCAINTCLNLSLFEKFIANKRVDYQMLCTEYSTVVKNGSLSDKPENKKIQLLLNNYARLCHTVKDCYMDTMTQYSTIITALPKQIIGGSDYDASITSMKRSLNFLQDEIDRLGCQIITDLIGKIDEQLKKVHVFQSLDTNPPQTHHRETRTRYYSNAIILKEVTQYLREFPDVKFFKQLSNMSQGCLSQDMCQLIKTLNTKRKTLKNEHLKSNVEANEMLGSRIFARTNLVDNVKDYLQNYSKSINQKTRINFINNALLPSLQDYQTNGNSTQILKIIRDNIKKFPGLRLQTILNRITVDILDSERDEGSGDYNKTEINSNSVNSHKKALNLLVNSLDKSEEKQKKQKKNYINRISRLYTAINDVQVSNKKTIDQKAGCSGIVTQLACKLTNDIDRFVIQNDEKQLPSEDAYNAFRELFRARLHSKDTDMSQSRFVFFIKTKQEKQLASIEKEFRKFVGK